LNTAQLLSRAREHATRAGGHASAGSLGAQARKAGGRGNEPPRGAGPRGAKPKGVQGCGAGVELSRRAGTRRGATGEPPGGRTRGGHLWVQIQRSPSPKPRAPWGEIEMGERGGCYVGELNEGKRPGEGRRAHREGQGARGTRAELGRAGLG
jgi:hypothetical protein